MRQVHIETAYKLEPLDPGFAAALHDGMWLDVSVSPQGSCQVLVMRHQPYLLGWADEHGVLHPGARDGKSQDRSLCNARIKLAARFPRPEGPNPLDHCEKKRRG